MLRQPVDLLVVGKHLVLELRRTDEPAPPRILNQWVFLRPPAKRIVVDVLFLVIEQSAGFQVAGDVLVAILYPASAAIVGSFISELAVGTDGAK